MSADTRPAREKLRMMAVHAHPDDEASKGAAAVAKYVHEGVDVTIVTCTGGERGDILNPAMADDPDALADLTAVRRREMEAARDVLGADHVWLGFVDSGLPEGDPVPDLPDGCFALLRTEEAARPLVQLIRERRPHVLTTYDENGHYPHPDHIMTHKISILAWELAADPTYRPELGEPWEISKLYYNMSMSAVEANEFHEYYLERGLDSPYEERLSWYKGLRQNPITTKVDVSDYLEYRDRALLAHATQVDPEGMFFWVSNEVRRLVWPWEAYTLHFSRIPVTIPEDDLFEGLRS